MFSNNTEQSKKYRAILYIVILATIPFYLIGIGVASYKISENNRNFYQQTENPQVIITINGTLFVGSGTDLLTLVPFVPTETQIQTSTLTYSIQPTKTLFIPPTYTPTLTPTATLIPTWTFIPLPTFTHTATATATLTPSLTPTNIPTIISTQTFTPVVPTNTAIPVIETTIAPTETFTEVPTNIPTTLPTETFTPTPFGTNTAVSSSSAPIATETLVSSE